VFTYLPRTTLKVVLRDFATPLHAMSSRERPKVSNQAAKICVQLCIAKVLSATFEHTLAIDDHFGYYGFYYEATLHKHELTS